MAEDAPNPVLRIQAPTLVGCYRALRQDDSPKKQSESSVLERLQPLSGGRVQGLGVSGLGYRVQSYGKSFRTGGGGVR